MMSFWKLFNTAHLSRVEWDVSGARERVWQDPIVMLLLILTGVSFHFNGHFPDGYGLTSTRMSPFWIILERDDGGSGDNWSYKMLKAPAKLSPPTNQHPVFLQVGCPSCHPANSVKALNGFLQVTQWIETDFAGVSPALNHWTTGK